MNRYIRWTLYGVKPDTASPPLKSLQIREEEVAAGEADAESVDGVRMTMFYYNCSGPKGAPPCSDASSGHFRWRRSGHLREGGRGVWEGTCLPSLPGLLTHVHRASACTLSVPRRLLRVCPGVGMRGTATNPHPSPAQPPRVCLHLTLQSEHRPHPRYSEADKCHQPFGGGCEQRLFTPAAVNRRTSATSRSGGQHGA